MVHVPCRVVAWWLEHRTLSQRTGVRVISFPPRLLGSLTSVNDNGGNMRTNSLRAVIAA